MKLNVSLVQYVCYIFYSNTHSRLLQLKNILTLSDCDSMIHVHGATHFSHTILACIASGAYIHRVGCPVREMRLNIPILYSIRMKMNLMIIVGHVHLFRHTLSPLSMGIPLGIMVRRIYLVDWPTHSYLHLLHSFLFNISFMVQIKVLFCNNLK